MDAVIAFTAPRLARKVLAIKGQAGFARPAIVRSKIKGKPLFICGVDSLEPGVVRVLPEGVARATVKCYAVLRGATAYSKGPTSVR
jgi:hypothetical protein